ncbi:hypothetical protein [Rhizomonospora bruguierae]|uniref:hypothetical protein n=1 Tax=Rhizomonospora bruguierae TaxID=1581705 RepID=UPI001BCD23C9|nr:hypothetical protein [Micromonospora sp. NBRC 107566]
MHAGRAQALALAGRFAEAERSVRRVQEVTDRMPATVLAAADSIFGWPEHRLRHTESYVYTHTGNTQAAMAAQEQTLSLYPESHIRLRTQVQLHRAVCLIKDGHVGDGLRYAATLIDELPREHHTAILYEVAWKVVAAVPVEERRRVEVQQMRERLAESASE